MNELGERIVKNSKKYNSALRKDPRAYSVCLIAVCWLRACCMLAECLLRACRVLAAFLLRACCVLATCLLRAYCVLAAFLVCTCLCFMFTLFVHYTLPEGHPYMPMAHLPVAVYFQIW